MFEHIIRRILLTFPSILIVGIVAFMLVQVTPGDPAAFFLGPDAPPGQAEELRARMGLDQPIYLQFYNWFSRVLRGDLGVSFHRNQSVLEMFLNAFPPTFFLAFSSLIVAVILGVPIGVLSALKQNSFFDKFSSGFILIGLGIPNFWWGMILIIFLSIYLGWFPVQGFVLPTESLYQSMRYLFLPAISLGYPAAAFIARMTRSSMLEEIGKDYIRTVRSKGVKESVIIFKHALRNGFNEILTVMGIVLVSLFSGSVAVELLFNYPGIGRLVVNSVFRRDYPVIQGSLILIALIVLLTNLLVDILYGIIDPRIRYE